MTPRVVVVGGGITGLALAGTLADDARRRGVPLDLTVLDAGGRAGGHAQTRHEHGFVVEAGPNGFLNREPHTLALVESLGLNARLVEARPESKRRFIVRDGRLCQVPDGPKTLLTTPALSWRAKLRLLREPFIPGASTGDDESVHAFAARRIGDEAADMLVDAAVSGISAGDSRRLSVRAQFPIMAAMERDHGSLVKAMFARRGKRTGGPARLLSFDQGMGTLTSALAASLGERLRLGATVRGVRHVAGEDARRGSAWRVALTDGSHIDADHVVLTVAARAAAPMLAAHDAALASELAAVEYAGLSVVALAYKTTDIPRALDGYGYLTTRPEGLATLGVVWESSLFPGRAPDGHVLLRVMLGGSRRPDIVTMPDARIADLARRDLQRVLGVTAAPVHTWTFAWPEAIAQYTLGHVERVAAIRERLARQAGLMICGTSYDGVSFNHAVKHGRQTALDLAERLWAGAAATAVDPQLQEMA